MEPLHLAHLIALGVWLGVVITEVLFEFAASDAESLRAAARFHYNVDKYGELPILVAVLVTGTMLTVRAWPLTPLHVLKVATSLASVASALVCVGWVFQRRRIEDVNVLLGFRRRIWTLAAVAAVFATPALYLGLVYFRQ
jgi:Na+/phosphate symporter